MMLISAQELNQLAIDTQIAQTSESIPETKDKSQIDSNTAEDIQSTNLPETTYPEENSLSLSEETDESQKQLNQEVNDPGKDKILAQENVDSKDEQVDQLEEEKEEEQEEEDTASKRKNVPKAAKTVHKYRQTMFGSQCPFPYVYEGKRYEDCLQAADGNEYCMLEEALYQCMPENQQHQKKPTLPVRPTKVEIRFTMKGFRCQLPLLYQNRYLTDCLYISSTQEVCQVDGRWHLCQPRVDEEEEKEFEATNLEAQQTVVRMTADGQQCEFPLAFDGKKYDDCVKMPDSNEWCKVNGAWKQCVQAAGGLNVMEQMQYEESYTPVSYEYVEAQQEISGQKGKGNTTTAIILSIFVVLMSVIVTTMIIKLIGMRSRYAALSKSQKN